MEKKISDKKSYCSNEGDKQQKKEENFNLEALSTLAPTSEDLLQYFNITITKEMSKM